jgi:maltose O-acetyltransferase
MVLRVNPRTASAIRTYRRNVLNGITASVLIPDPLRRFALRHLLGVRIGRAKVCAGGFFGGGQPITIGDGTYINRGVYINASAAVTIGGGVSFGMGVLIVTGSHELGTREQRAGAATAAPITVGTGAWIGARATILPGVTVGPGAVIGAGAVVTGDCAADTLYTGIPARPVRTLGTADAAMVAADVPMLVQRGQELLGGVEQDRAVR